MFIGKKRLTNYPVTQLVDQEPDSKSMSLSPPTFHKVTCYLPIDDVINLSGCSGTLKLRLQEAISDAGDLNTSNKDVSVWFCASREATISNPVKDYPE